MLAARRQTYQTRRFQNDGINKARTGKISSLPMSMDRHTTALLNEGISA